MNIEMKHISTAVAAAASEVHIAHELWNEEKKQTMCCEKNNNGENNMEGNEWGISFRLKRTLIYNFQLGGD